MKGLFKEREKIIKTLKNEGVFLEMMENSYVILIHIDTSVMKYSEVKEHSVRINEVKSAIKKSKTIIEKSEKRLTEIEKSLS